jgi:outer membrane receptor for Fe3+-dicitrate
LHTIRSARRRTSSGGAPKRSSISTSSSATASSSGASASSVSDACALLAKTDVEAVVGAVIDQPSSTSAPMTGVADKASVCVYRGANGLLTVAVLSKAMTRSDFDSVMRQVPGVQAISGIGDAAFGTSAGTTGANGASILVLKGTTYFTIVATSSSTDGSTMLTSLKTLAGKITDKL